MKKFSFLLTITLFCFLFSFSLKAQQEVYLYVSQTTGSDTTGDGSQANPYATIGKAINWLYDNLWSYAEVRVAAGVYPECVHLSGLGEILKGGYDPDTWKRNITVYRTILDGCGVYVDGGLSSGGVDGFFLKNASIYGMGSISVVNCVIQDGKISMSAEVGPGDCMSSYNGYLFLKNTLITGTGTAVETHASTETGYCYSYYGCNCCSTSVYATIINSTIAGNSVGVKNSYYLAYPCSNPPGINTKIRNSILFNQVDDLDLKFNYSVTYSNIGESWGGTGNISVDPKFWDPSYPDHGLMPGSSCIDAGDGNTAYNDPDGTRNDMGFTGGPDTAFFDSDYDGMPDSWETYYGLNPNDPGDALLDCDGDSVTNRDEYFRWTDPGLCNDVDGDGLPDAYESAHGCLMANTADADQDPDGDGFTNLQEFQTTGTDPCLCTDGDGDGRGAGCGAGSDCDDTNANAWDTCATCNDDDGDSWYELCDAYNGINGPDCDDTNANAWNTCATCNDDDGDSWYELCDGYNGIKGPDCDDTNQNAWTSCSTCNDDDGDSWYELCDAYNGINGPDCDDGDSQVNPGRSETMCDGKDNDCNPGTPDDRDQDGDGLSYCQETSLGTSDTVQDTDGDGLTDGEEVNTYSTDPLNPDTDGDGMNDGDEVDRGGDPLTPAPLVIVKKKKVSSSGPFGCMAAGSPAGSSSILIASGLPLSAAPSLLLLAIPVLAPLLFRGRAKHNSG